MGNKNRRNDGEGTSGAKKEVGDEKYEKQEIQFLHTDVNGFIDPLVHLQTRGHVAYQTPPPPLLIQQPHELLQNGYVESVLHERLKSVKFTWNHPATNVAIAGSWDNWDTTEPLQNAGQSFVIVKTLPIGIYHYRFIVDGYWTHAPQFPYACDVSGHAYNILDLQDYIPETLGRLSDFEDPPSPPSSYDNIFLDEGEFSKPPPELPPQRPVTIRQDNSTINGQLFPRPSHVELNHLYIQKADRGRFVALRSTHRFQHKYVTMVLYKSLPMEL